MRNTVTATMLAASFVLTSAPLGAEQTAWSVAPPSGGSTRLSSDADLLAERHFGLYRASQLPTNLSRDAEESSEASAIVVRTSATAALPLSPSTPPHREARSW